MMGAASKEEDKKSNKERKLKLLPLGQAAGEKPWMSDHTVPSNWVLYEELDGLRFSRSTPLTVTQAMSTPEFAEDHTTNVQAKNRFYRGIFPTLGVNIAELTPNKDDARFGPKGWGLRNSERNLLCSSEGTSQRCLSMHPRHVNVFKSLSRRR